MSDVIFTWHSDRNGVEMEAVLSSYRGIRHLEKSLKDGAIELSFEPLNCLMGFSPFENN